MFLLKRKRGFQSSSNFQINSQGSMGTFKRLINDDSKKQSIGTFGVECWSINDQKSR